MANIFLIVEGDTEEQFVKKILQPEYISSDGIYLHNLTVTKIPSKRNAYSRNKKGGTVTYDTCVDVIKRFLRQASNSDLILLVLDYYGLHESFKSHLTAENRTLAEKVTAIQDRLEKDIQHPKFKFRLQVHEFEALLFSEPEITARHFTSAHGDKKQELESLLQSFDNNPELINDNPKTAPSKRMKSIFPSFEKLTDGISIAQKTGISAMRKKCTHFNQLCQLIDEMPAD